MAHTYTNLLTHIIFSTKHRSPMIDSDLAQRLHPYMGGIVKQTLQGIPFSINGVADHVHLLIKLPPTVNISDSVREIKARSSGWIHKHFLDKAHFAWQSGYGAFTVSHSNSDDVIAYIRDQERHHRKMTFKEEFIGFLKRNNIPYHERYIWD